MKSTGGTYDIVYGTMAREQIIRPTALCIYSWSAVLSHLRPHTATYWASCFYEGDDVSAQCG